MVKSTDMTNRVRLTRAFLKDLPPPGNALRIFWDTDVKGLSIEQSPKGKVVFKFKGRPNGKQVFKKIGSYPAMMPEQAREIARSIAVGEFYGRDVLKEIQEKRSAPADLTFAELIPEFLEVQKAKKRKASAAEDERKLEKRLLPKFGKKLVKEITSNDIEKFHIELKKTPVEANRNLALLSSIFNYAIKKKCIRSDNPTTDVEKYEEHQRQRYLSKDEAERFREALAVYAVSQPDAVNGLLFIAETGCRRGEMISASWEQFDFKNGKNGVWTKPAAFTKQNKFHRVLISTEAQAAIQRQAGGQAKHSGFVFSPGLSREGYLTAVRRLFSKVCRDAELKDFHIHDLRHTFASSLVTAGVSLVTTGSMLGHTTAKMTLRYAHVADEAQKEALAKLEAAK